MDRYIVYASLAFISANYLIVALLRNKFPRPIRWNLQIAVLCLFAVDAIYIGYNSENFTAFENIQIERSAALKSLRNDEDSGFIKKIYPFGLASIKKQTDFLKAQKLGPFKTE